MDGVYGHIRFGLLCRYEDASKGLWFRGLGIDLWLHMKFLSCRSSYLWVLTVFEGFSLGWGRVQFQSFHSENHIDHVILVLWWCFWGFCHYYTLWGKKSSRKKVWRIVQILQGVLSLKLGIILNINLILKIDDILPLNDSINVFFLWFQAVFS